MKVRNALFAAILSCLTVMKADAQTEKFDMATFTPPAGWDRKEVNGALAFMHTEMIGNSTNFCQIILYPGNTSKASADKNFKASWENLVSIPAKTNVKPTVHSEKSPDGWTLVVGTANLVNQGLQYKTIVTSVTGFSRTMALQVNTAGGDYAAVLEKFFNELEFDSRANTSGSNNGNNMIALSDYSFTEPEKWQVQNGRDFVSFVNPNSGCSIKILAPQPSSGSTEQDANSVFDMMYKGWNFQKSGERKFILAKGILPNGLEYVMKEAAMSGTNVQGQYILEEGAAVVVKAGSQIVIMAVRHNSGALGHDDCYRNYNTWGRFLNSFTVKNIPTASSTEEEASKRILGLWKIDAVGIVAGDYVFAANGHYQFGGALGSSTTTSDMYYKYIYSRAYPFEGDGIYSVSGNRLTLEKRGDAGPEQVIIRFEKVNHGGTGWKDRLYMLKKVNDRQNESLYEKQEKLN